MEMVQINKQEVIKYLSHLNEYEYIKRSGSDKEVLIFKNRDEIFKIYGEIDKEILSPFNDYTYNWLNSFLSNVIDFINHNDFNDFEELENSIQNVLYEWVDSETDIYTSDLTAWLADNNTNQYYLEEAIKEYPEGENHIQMAQYKAIEELFNNALNVLIEDLKNQFEE
jgi:hypothetical protein